MTVQVLRKAPASFETARRDAAHFIDGVFTQGSTGKFWENRTPIDNSLIGRVPEGGKAEVDAACRAANAALSGPWGRMTVAERTDMLARSPTGSPPARRVPGRRDADTGKPSSLARHLDIPRGAANFKMFADVGEERARPSPSSMADPGRQAARSTTAPRRPKGVIAVICAVEPAAAADDLEGRPGARLRQHRRRQAVRGDAVDGDAARRGDERGRHAQGRLQRRARLRPELRRRVPDAPSAASTPSPSPAKRAPARRS